MNKWPKQLPELTPEQRQIRDDFMKHWHEVMPGKYGVMEWFNHGFPARNSKCQGRTLEIGAGLGEHIAYEDLKDAEYYALELRPEMAETIKSRFSRVITIVGDCQKRLDFPDDHFDRIIAIHVLEHLPDLPAALKEAQRLLKPEGEFAVVIPCEGGLAYWMARRISAQRIFEKRYKMPYDWCIKSEHINEPVEIIDELEKLFAIRQKTFFPLLIPLIHANLAIGMILAPRKYGSD